MKEFGPREGVPGKPLLDPPMSENYAMLSLSHCNFRISNFIVNGMKKN